MRHADPTIKLALLSVRSSAVHIALSGSTPPQIVGRTPQPAESLDEVAWSDLKAMTGVRAGYLEQLYTFSFPGDPRGDIVISYLGLVSPGFELQPDWVWTKHEDAFPLVGEHDQLILEYALIRLRAKIGYTTIAFQLMPQSFTLGELQQTFESILSRPLDPRNFRRRMVSSGLLESENRLRRDGNHRPAALYRFSGEHDPASYLTPLVGLAPGNGSDSEGCK
jgi:8-oxo-dGTP diphosphatase